MNEWMDYQKRERRRRYVEAALAWAMAVFAVIGVYAVLTFLIVTFG